MLLCNRGFRRLLLSSCGAGIIAAGGSWWISGCLAKHFVGEQVHFALHILGGGRFLDAPAEEYVTAGEAVISAYGIDRNIDPRMLDSFSEIRMELFGGILILCLAVILFVSLIAFLEQMKTCHQLEKIRQDCTELAEQMKTSASPRGEDFSCIRRVSDGVNLLAKRLSYFREMLVEERSFQKEFLTDFSHQMKTSLAVIRLNTDMLTEMQLSEEKQQQLMAEVSSHLDGMQEMVISALRLAKLNAGAVVYEKETTDISRTCQEALRRLSPVFRERKITIEAKLSSDIQLHHDRLWLCEAIENLLQNCAEHGECTQLVIALENLPGAVKLTISDNGRGIPQSEIPHLFERFRKKDRGMGKNFGVGMEIARKVIEAHKGSVSVYSEENKGTEFEIIFLN